MAQIIECWLDSCLARAMLLAVSPDFACCVYGCWIGAFNWRGTAHFLLQGHGGLSHGLLHEQARLSLHK
eukprot:1161135-Pelagomonas_calceolata.AAC.3